MTEKKTKKSIAFFESNKSMSTTNCFDILNGYAEFLNVNTNIPGVRPHPLFFSGINCSGKQWPDITLDPASGQQYFSSTAPPNQFGSMYVPAGWRALLVNTKSDEQSFPDTQQDLPVLITDASTRVINGRPILNDIVLVELFSPTYNGNPYTVIDWKLDMCQNKISSVVGAQHLVSFQPGSAECDAFMTSFCAPVSALSCAANSTEIAPVPDPYGPCVCLIEQNCLRDSFCLPNSTDPQCVNNQAFALYIPVTCFGKQCSLQGYRWGYMQQQRCDVTLCEQIINLVGNAITLKGGSTLFCGNSDIALSPTPTPTDTGAASGVNIETWQWILIAIGVFIVTVTIPLAIFVYHQAQKRKAAQVAAGIINSAH